MIIMDTTTLVENVLLKLDGWVLKTDVDSENLSDMEYNKAIDEEEILHYYNLTVDYAKTYTGNYDIEFIPVAVSAITMWCAGLLWKKYNVRSNDQIDETFTVGYGDSLIIQAKEMLKPYKNYGFYVY